MHNILDWRTALDLARLALDPYATVDFSTGHWQSLVGAATTAYFNALGWTPAILLGLPFARSGTCGELITHPLWADSHPAISQAESSASANGVMQFRSKSLFELVRRPF